MKQLIIILGLFISFNLSAQSQLASFIESLDGAEDVVNINLDGMDIDFTDDDGKKQSIEIENLKVSTFKGSHALNDATHSKLHNLAKSDDMELLVVARDKKEKVEIFIKENGELISNVFVLVQDPEETTLVLVSGAFTFDSLKGMNFDFKGANQLGKIKVDKN